MSLTTRSQQNFKLRLLIFFNSLWLGAIGGMLAWHTWIEHQAGVLVPAWRQLSSAALTVKFFQLPTMDRTPWARSAHEHMTNVMAWLNVQSDATQIFLLSALKTYLTWAPLVGAVATTLVAVLLVNLLTRKASQAEPQA